MKCLILIIQFFSVLTFAATDLEAIKSDIKLLSVASGNDMHKISTYDVATLDADAELLALFSRGLKAGCQSPKSVVFSPNNEEWFLKEALKYAKIDFESALREVYGLDDEVNLKLPKIFSTVADYLKDPKTKLVIYSGYNRTSPDSSEACSYYRFRIYRHDGNLILLNFDFTD